MRLADLELRPIADKDQRCAVLELAFAVCAVDGHLADEELATFRDLVTALQGRPATDDDVSELIERFVEKGHTLGVEHRVARIALNVPPELRETALSVAYALSLVDGEESEYEVELLAEVVAHLGIEPRRAAELRERAAEPQ